VLSEGSGREVEGVSLCTGVHEETHIAVCHLSISKYLFLIQY
jgi:hypothetical protein